MTLDELFADFPVRAGMSISELEKHSIVRRAAHAFASELLRVVPKGERQDSVVALVFQARAKADTAICVAYGGKAPVMSAEALG